MVLDRSDEELLSAFLAGDGRSFDALMSRHEDRLFSMAYRMTGNRSDALDAVQDAFLAAFRNARSFKGTAAFSTWLYRIGINACTDLLRKRKRIVPVAEVEVESSPGRIEGDVSLRMDLIRALEALTPEHREAVVMHDLGGYPYEEIAALTGVQLGTVKSRISRGRRRLAELLEQPEGAGSSKEHT